MMWVIEQNPCPYPKNRQTYQRHGTFQVSCYRTPISFPTSLRLAVYLRISLRGAPESPFFTSRVSLPISLCPPRALWPWKFTELVTEGWRLLKVSDRERHWVFVLKKLQGRCSGFSSLVRSEGLSEPEWALDSESFSPSYPPVLQISLSAGFRSSWCAAQQNLTSSCAVLVL